MRRWRGLLFLGCLMVGFTSGSLIMKGANSSLNVLPLNFERFVTPSGGCMMLWLRGIPGEEYWIESIPFGQANRPWAQWERLDNSLRQNGPILCLSFSEFLMHQSQYRAIRRQKAAPVILGSLPPATPMVWIEPGVFTLGSPRDEIGREVDEGPQTVVSFTKPYALGAHEVTQAQYVAVMEENPSRFKADDHPVANMTWERAREYCRRLTVLEHAAGLLDPGLAYRLPSEAEWEYACRAGSSTRFYYGDDPDYEMLGAFAWYRENSGWSTQPVMTRLPNAWGLFGMHGNVHEWCADSYAFLPSGSVEDPEVFQGGEMHVIRGGSWLSLAKDCRSADRHRDWFTVYIGTIGFRVALSAVE